MRQKDMSCSIDEHIYDNPTETLKYLQGLKMECQYKDNALRTADNIIASLTIQNQNLLASNNLLKQQLNEHCQPSQTLALKRQLMKLKKYGHEMENKEQTLINQVKELRMKLAEAHAEIEQIKEDANISWNENQKNLLADFFKSSVIKHQEEHFHATPVNSNKQALNTPSKHLTPLDTEDTIQDLPPTENKLRKKLKQKQQEVKALLERVRVVQHNYSVVVKQLKPRRTDDGLQRTRKQWRHD